MHILMDVIKMIFVIDFQRNIGIYVHTVCVEYLRINFVHGRVTNPYDKSIYGVGFIGSGNYDSHNISYPVWFNMIKRCYKEQKSYDDESYEDYVVDIEWHNFQDFTK